MLKNCNLCNYESIVREAKRENLKVSLFAKEKGHDVYVHPRSIRLNPKLKKHREKYWVAWFWIIPEKCDCEDVDFET